MATRHLYLARHGAADALGTLTETGRRQAQLLGRRLARLPMDVVWHSPLPRAAASAEEIAEHLPGVPVIEAPELVDHVPHVPRTDRTPPSWIGFFDGYTAAEATAEQQIAETLVARFGGLATPTAPRTPRRHPRAPDHPLLSDRLARTARRRRTSAPMAGTGERECSPHPHRAPHRPAGDTRAVQRHGPPAARPPVDRVHRHREAVTDRHADITDVPQSYLGARRLHPEERPGPGRRPSPGPGPRVVGRPNAP